MKSAVEICSDCINRVSCRAHDKSPGNSSVMAHHPPLCKCPKLSPSIVSIRSSSSSSSSLSCFSPNDRRHRRNRSRVFPLDQLPIQVIVNVIEELGYVDASNIRLVLKKFHSAERAARAGRKCLSASLLRQLFPEKMGKSYRLRRIGAGIGLLECSDTLRHLFRNTLPATLREIDLSEFSSFGRQHFWDVLKALDAECIFKDVHSLNLRNCVMGIKDLEALSCLLPEVRFIKITTEHIVYERIEVSHLSQEDMNKLQELLGSHDALRSTSKCRQQAISQLTRYFHKLELIQLE